MSNVTDAEFAKYLRIFHDTLSETAERHLAQQHRHRLRNLGYLPARIVGYVSTKHGVGFEYERADTTSIEVIRGSGPVEELLLRAPSQLARGSTMFMLRDSSSV